MNLDMYESDQSNISTEWCILIQKKVKLKNRLISFLTKYLLLGLSFHEVQIQNKMIAQNCQWRDYCIENVKQNILYAKTKN